MSAINFVWTQLFTIINKVFVKEKIFKAAPHLCNKYTPLSFYVIIIFYLRHATPLSHLVELANASRDIFNFLITTIFFGMPLVFLIFRV